MIAELCGTSNTTSSSSSMAWTPARRLATSVALFITLLLTWRHFSGSSHAYTTISSSSSNVANVITHNGMTCPPGFRPSLAHICEPGPAGYWINEHFEVLLCPKDAWCPIGSSQPIACPSAQTTITTGATNELACHCNAGFYLASSNDNNEPSSTSCRLCPENAWCDTNRLYSCGIYAASDVGSTSRAACRCQSSSYILARPTSSTSVECVICPDGHQCNGTIVSTMCPKNSYCMLGIMTSCPADKPHSAAGATSVAKCHTAGQCDDGSYRANDDCIICPRGSYCTNGEKKSCPLSHWCAAGSSVATLCIRVGIADDAPSISSGMSDDGNSDPCWPKDQPYPAALTAWHMKPMTDIIDNDDGPLALPSAALLRADRMHFIIDGLSLGQFRYWHVIEQAICARRHWVLPSWRTRIQSDIWLPWEAVWEWKNFSRGVSKHFGVATLLPSRLTKDDRKAVKFTECAVEDDLPPEAATEIKEEWNDVGARHWVAANFISFAYLRPADHLQLAIADVHRGWRGSYTCLHLRTEGDWTAYFGGGPARQSVQQVIDRFTASWHMAHSNHHDAAVHARLFATKRLFVAGEHTKQAIEDLGKAFAVMFPLGVFAKATIGFDTKYAWDKTEYTNIESAVIDREICSTADQFVGNVFSGWSISVYGRRVYSPHHQSMGTWLANGQYNWMTNPASKDEDWKGPLNPFCANAYEIKCPHFGG